eukprot:CAMPEP_0182809266 /NCGR_PEP_ID=MMETSP0006_2-20121128/7091_1 /TAXON_ID=97485 /ORGANISM="Prymnesium parvum, Strain Texoma1" /LENGTH=35 /DNA_ID= /DNA_START= /DNA_END= /DNA_ORIENTATION=
MASRKDLNKGDKVPRLREEELRGQLSSNVSLADSA